MAFFEAIFTSVCISNGIDGKPLRIFCACHARDEEICVTLPPLFDA